MRKKIQTPIKKKDRLKWNFTMGLLHGIFFNGAMGFSDSNTVLPAFISSLTHSKILLGLFASTIEGGGFSRLGSVIPQLFVANKVETRISKKPLLVKAIIVRALCWGILAGFTFFLDSSQSLYLLFMSFFLLTLFTLMGGIASIPFMDIWGKAIPSTLRGRFFGYRQLFGGALAIASGIVVQRILGNSKIPFPKNFAFLFFLSFVLISFSYVALGSVKEPIEEVHKDSLKFGQFLKKAIIILKDDKNYQRFIFVQFLRGAGALALPFYVIYAREALKIPLGMVGVFISAQMLGGLLSNFLWAYISDYVGNKKVIQISLITSFLIPITVLLIAPGFSFLFAAVFVLIGFSINGSNIGYTNYLLDISPSKKRPTYIGLTSTFLAPTALFPLIGGVIIQYTSFLFLFSLTTLFVFIGFLLSLKLKEPRNI